MDFLATMSPFHGIITMQVKAPCRLESHSLLQMKITGRNSRILLLLCCAASLRGTHSLCRIPMSACKGQAGMSHHQSCRSWRRPACLIWAMHLDRSLGP